MGREPDCCNTLSLEVGLEEPKRTTFVSRILFLKRYSLSMLILGLTCSWNHRKIINWSTMPLPGFSPDSLKLSPSQHCWMKKRTRRDFHTPWLNIYQLDPTRHRALHLPLEGTLCLHTQEYLHFMKGTSHSAEKNIYWMDDSKKETAGAGFSHLATIQLPPLAYSHLSPGHSLHSSQIYASKWYLLIEASSDHLHK